MKFLTYCYVGFLSTCFVLVHGLDIVFDLPAELRYNTSHNIILTTFDATQGEQLSVAIRILVTASNILLFNEQRTLVTNGAVNTYDFTVAVNPKRRQCRWGRPPNTLCTCVIEVTVTSSSRSWSTNRNVPLVRKKAHIFVSTDRPVYRPSDKVYFRFIPVDDRLNPLKASMSMQVMAPNPTPGGSDLLSWNKTKAPSKGVFFREFKIPDTPPFGEWKVKAHFKSSLIEQTTFANSFYVQDYTLPTFDVNIEPGSSFILPDDTTFPLAISAKYIHGEILKGSAHARFGILKSSTGEVEGGLVTTHIEHVKTFISSQSFNVPISSLIGKYLLSNLVQGNFKLFIEVSVTDYAQGMTRTVQNTDVVFTSSPYVISFGYTPGFYKPGLPFTVQITTKFVNGSEAVNVPVVIRAQAERLDGRPVVLNQKQQTTCADDGSLLTHFTAPDNTRNIVVMVAAQYISSNGKVYPTTINRTFKPQTSPLNEHIQIYFPRAKLDVGITEAIEVYVTPSTHSRTVVYTVTSKERLLQQGQTTVPASRDRVVIAIAVTAEMSPVSHITAYYVTQNPSGSSSYITADSAILRVVDSCQGKEPRMQVVLGDELPYPGKDLTIQVVGQSSSYVGVTGVDAAALSLRKEFFSDKTSDAANTRKNSFEVLRNFSPGCKSLAMPSPQYAFSAIGRRLASSVSNGNTDLSTTTCSNGASSGQNRRKKRSLNVDSTILLKKGRQGLDFDCCAVGARDITNVVLFDDPRTYCEQRKKKVKMSETCRTVFYQCCLEARCKRTNPLGGCSGDIDRRVVSFGTLDPTGSGFEVVYKRAENIRSNFDETWFAIDFKLGESGQIRLNNSSHPRIPPLPHSITSWSVAMFSLSPDNGMCVLEPFLFPVQHDLYIDLKIPSKPVVRGKLISITVTVFSYLQQRVDTLLILEGSEYLCGSSDSSNPAGLVKHASLNPSSGGIPSTVIKHFNVIPLKIGKLDIRVTMQTNLNSPQPAVVDNVVKKLLVIAEGDTKRKIEWKLIAVNNQISRRSSGPTTVRSLNLDIPQNAIPGTEHVSFTLHGLGSAVIRRPQLNDDDTETSSIAQYLYLLQYTVISLRYLQNKNQLTDGHLANLTNDAQSAYNGLLSFANDLTKGSQQPLYAFSFAPAPYSTVDIWLTSATLRLLVESAQLIAPDQTILEGCLRWILSHQTSFGNFDNKPTTAAQPRSKRSSCRELQSLSEQRNCRRRRSVDKNNLRLPIFKGSRDRKVYRTSVIAAELHVIKKLAQKWKNGIIRPLLLDNEISRENRLESVKPELAVRALRNAASFVRFRIHRMRRSNKASPITLCAAAHFLQLALGRNARHLPALEQSILRWKRPLSGSSDSLRIEANTDVDQRVLTKNQRIQIKSATVEATAYQLMILELRAVGGEKYANWLLQKRGADGRWMSLRDNLAAVYSLVEYALEYALRNHNTRSNSLRVQLGTTGSASPIITPFELGGHSSSSSANIPVSSNSVSLRTEGSGQAWLEVDVSYNVASTRSLPNVGSSSTENSPTRDLKACPYNVSIRVATVSPLAPFRVHARSSNRLSKEFYSINVVVKLTEESLAEQLDDETYVIDINLANDVKPLQSDLDELSNPVESWVDHYRITKRGVLLYMTGESDIKFRVKAPLESFPNFPVSVYPAAYPERRCTTSYRLSGPTQVSTLCSTANVTSAGTMCACAVGLTCPRYFSRSQAADMTGDARKAATCSPGIVFAFRIRILSEAIPMDGWLVLNATIIEVYKNCGAANGITRNSVQTFWVKNTCEDSKYHPNKQYLVMGKHVVHHNGRSHKLLLDHNSSVEWWPTRKCAQYSGTKKTICTKLNVYNHLILRETCRCTL